MSNSNGVVNGKSDKDDSQVMMKAKEICDLLDISVTSLFKLMKANKMPPPLVLGKRTLRWHRKEIMAWLSAGIPGQEPSGVVLAGSAEIQANTFAKGEANVPGVFPVLDEQDPRFSDEVAVNPTVAEV